MNVLFIVLTVQIVLGALDNFWHHEITERLPAKRSARIEIALHSAREFFYAFLFFALAWTTWHGVWAYILIGFFVLELVITLIDFVVEDRTRRLPALERVLHTILAINAGVFMALFVPIVLEWATFASEIRAADYGLWSIFLSLSGLGVLIWSIRDAAAALRWMRPPVWRREPIVVGNKQKPRTVLVTGATGFIGKHLCRLLLSEGDVLIVLTRDVDKAWEYFGESVRVITDFNQINNAERIDAVINLAGAPIAAWFWTNKRRQILLESRIKTTQGIVTLAERLTRKPDVLVNASAIGYYGIHTDQCLTETDVAGEGFQSELCRSWEQAAAGFSQFGARVCALRFGLVLGISGGVLPQLMMSLRFRSHVILGSGDQWVSWIHVRDLIRLIVFALDNDAVSGPVNATSPYPVKHMDLMSDLAKRRGSLLGIKVPAGILRACLGELAQLFVDGQKVMPEMAQRQGFKFQFESLSEALDDLLNNTPSDDKINIYYDGACPVCRAEINHYRRAGDEANVAIAFTDLEHAPHALVKYKLDSDIARQRLYVRLSSGSVKSGMDALIEIWRRLPGYGWLAKLTSMPVMYSVCSLGYDVLAAPIITAWSAKRRSS